ncbi:hypothetical protein LB505_013008 [Fusarium chuoi]|nr:hypothetical protein LB505_013008 [Fusarium chuoi]
MELGDEEDMEEKLTDVEEKIASVWAESLKIDRSVIRRSHSFTDLGGTSIEAIRVVAELREHGLATELGDLLAYASLNCFCGGRARPDTLFTSPGRETTFRSEGE